MRDARIAQIYEGANGVQALDLMGRKIVRNNGELLNILLSEMDEFSASQKDVEAMQSSLAAFGRCRECLLDATAVVIAQAADNPGAIGAASYPYMELTGLTLYCFMWQKMLAAAFLDCASASGDSDYADSIINTGRFFIERLLPRADSLVAEIASGAESLMSMTAEQF